MRILSIGNLKGISNTCLHRHQALVKLGHHVDAISTNEKKLSLIWRIKFHLFLWGFPIRVPENNSENQKIRDMILKKQYDVIWIDKGLTINPETLIFIKKHSEKTKIVSYSPDNMALRHNQTQQYIECIPYYDCIVTNKSYIINDLKKLGAKNVIFVNNSYESSFHYPRKLSHEDCIRLGDDIGFVGMWEQERANSILYLAKNGLNIRVWGDKKWIKYKGLYPNLKIEKQGLYSEDYAKSFKAFKICLCFLRKINYDQQTTRSVEIPACGGFMIAERTDEHLSLFAEDKEAVFFSSNQELLSKCRYYLKHEEERKCIALSGYERCVSSGYSNINMVRYILASIFDYN